MAVINCPHCGHYMSSESSVCPNCGKSLDSAIQEGGKSSKYSWKRLTMRKRIYICFILVLLSSIAFFLVKDHQRAVGLELRAYERLEGCTNLHWFEDYIVRFPDGEHIAEVRQMYEKAKVEQKEFFLQCSNGTKEELLRYIKEHPTSPYCKMCENRVDSIDWSVALEANTADAFSAYLREHPNGLFAEVATEEKARKAKLEVSEDERNLLRGAVDNFLSAMTVGDVARVNEMISSSLTFCGVAESTGDNVAEFYQSHFKKDDILGVHFSVNNGMNIRKSPSTMGEGLYNYSISADVEATLNRTATDSVSTETWGLSASLTPDRKFTSVSLNKN